MTKLGICVYLIITYFVQTYMKQEYEERFYVKTSDKEDAITVHELQSAPRFTMGFSNIYSDTSANE